ncbi:BESS motif [Popillia japonica]|uniref:BESS motif n=1 Tax=Popillia japonica TaxID=7064 RepID=A0AAW1MCY1_POPJA
MNSIATKISKKSCSERLIVEVEKRPGLYNKKFPEYSDKNIKEKLWKDVCEVIIPNWSQFEGQQKVQEGKDIQNKWKNLRDSFRKELNLQKQTKSGDPNKKRRKYLCFEQMLFLIPVLQDRETTSNYSGLKESTENESSPGEEHVQADIEKQSNNADTSLQTTTKVMSRREKKRKAPTYEESLLQILRETTNEEIDEDKTFLLSLLPSFKKLSPQQKLRTKMESLEVMQRGMFPDSDREQSMAYSQPFYSNAEDHQQMNCQSTHSQLYPQDAFRMRTQLGVCSSRPNSQSTHSQLYPQDAFRMRTQLGGTGMVTVASEPGKPSPFASTVCLAILGDGDGDGGVGAGEESFLSFQRVWITLKEVLKSEQEYATKSVQVDMKEVLKSEQEYATKSVQVDRLVEYNHVPLKVL